MMKYFIGILMACCMFFTTSPATTGILASLSLNSTGGNLVTASAASTDDVLSGTGVKKVDNKKGVIGSMNDIVKIVTTIGIIISVLFFVIGGILLSASAGNAMRRGVAIACIISAGIGAYITIRAYDLVGWAINV